MTINQSNNTAFATYFLGTIKRLITNIMLLSKRELYAHVKFVG